MKKDKKSRSFNIPIEHDQIISSVEVVDRYTGEVNRVEPEVKVKPSKPKNGMKKFDLMEQYHRRNTTAWHLLSTQTSSKEYEVAIKLSDMSSAFIGSLEPINDSTSANELANILHADRRTIKSLIDKLFKLGVIGKFEVYEAGNQYKRYWLFNPYLSFNGDIIKEDVATLFDGTYYAKK